MFFHSAPLLIRTINLKRCGMEKRRGRCEASRSWDESEWKIYKFEDENYDWCRFKLNSIIVEFLSSIPKSSFQMECNVMWYPDLIRGNFILENFFPPRRLPYDTTKRRWIMIVKVFFLLHHFSSLLQFCSELNIFPFSADSAIRWMSITCLISGKLGKIERLMQELKELRCIAEQVLIIFHFTMRLDMENLQRSGSHERSRVNSVPAKREYCTIFPHDERDSDPDSIVQSKLAWNFIMEKKWDASKSRENFKLFASCTTWHFTSKVTSQLFCSLLGVHAKREKFNFSLEKEYNSIPFSLSLVAGDILSLPFALFSLWL